MKLAVDHLIVAAHSLAQGVAWCEETLGVTPGAGGKHALMGTHNRLLKIETPAFAQAYLEIIAIDPEAPPPQRARWFGLDGAALQARLKEAPRLIHWVARSDSLERHVDLFAGMGHDVGAPVHASRETAQGLLSWRIVLRDDGALACGGALPTLIEWGATHPTQAMAPSGVTLQGLMLRGLTEPMDDMWPAGVQVAQLPGAPTQAWLHTPRGSVVLTS
jgi:hypothetical protein